MPRARLYVNVAGGAIERAERDDALLGLSSVCGATVPRFAHEAFGRERTAVVASLVAAIAELFAGLEIEVSAEQPSLPPFHMVMVGGRPSLCGMADGIAGLAPLDCDNRSPADIAFIFAEPLTAIEVIALATAHETGHMLGLPHTMAPCDVMSNFLCPSGPKRFLDQPMEVAPDHRGRCGLQTANSHELLLGALRKAGIDTSLTEER